MWDEIGIMIIYITVFVLYARFLLAPHTTSANLRLIALLLCSINVFCSYNSILLYFAYEASLIPILFIIIKWGSYPERSVSSIILLMYTVVFTLPFIFNLLILFRNNARFSLAHFHTRDWGRLISILVFLCFSVKLPVYGLHFWLPIAHVEAPTFGSIILAGVLLKLGGVGLMRLSSIYCISGLKTWLLSYLIICLTVVTVICCLQSDIKRLIAFSSVRHMIAIPPLVILDTNPSFRGCTLIILFHGLSSPILFILRGIVYSVFSTRQLNFIRGCLIIRPVVSFLAVIGFLFSMSAPPFPSFFSEVIFFFCATNIDINFCWSLLLFAFLSIVYNLNWLTSLLFSPYVNNLYAQIQFSALIPLLISIIGAAFLIIFITLF